MKNFALILTSLLFCSSTVWGQISRQEKKIDAYYESFNYVKAIAKYEKLKSISLEGKRKLAESYRKTYNYEKSKTLYSEWIDTDKATKEDLFNYASILRLMGDYEKSNHYLSKFSTLFPRDLRARDFLANARNFSAFSTERGLFTIENLHFNTEETDFGPAYFGDKIVFASSRARKKQFAELYNWNQKPYLNLFVSRVHNGQFLDLQQLKKSINKKWHEGTASFYNKGRFMVFTRDNYGAKGEINLQLFFSAFTGSDWSKPLPFKYNNPDYSFGHPSISEDGNTLYFASNMPGGFGGVDLYRTHKDSTGQWSVPENLGESINTEEDDMFPFFEEKSQTLFFASRGHLGLGGLDIFRAKKKGNSFVDAKNIGAPINSMGDDFALIIDPSLSSGYFSSNRKEGRGDDDIYSFKVEQPIYQTDFTLNLVVMDEKRKAPVADAEIVYNDTAKYKTNADGNATWHLPFNSENKLAVSAKGLLSQTKNIKVSESDEYEILRDTLHLMKDTVVVRIFDATKASTKTIVLRHVYYNFNRWDLLPASFVELDKVVALLNANSALKAELSSHTDRRGSDKYNLKLSQLRAQSAVDYLVEKGVDKSRVNAVGYGKRKLINPCVDCSEEQHRENRRTEIALPGFIQSVEDSLQFNAESVAVDQSTKANSSFGERVDRGAEHESGEIRYWLYVASAKDREWAQKLADKLSKEGYNATVIDVDNFYRVGIGCPSLKATRQIYNTLKFRFRTAWFDYAK